MAGRNAYLTGTQIGKGESDEFDESMELAGGDGGGGKHDGRWRGIARMKKKNRPGG